MINLLIKWIKYDKFIDKLNIYYIFDQDINIFIYHQIFNEAIVLIAIG